MSSSGMGRDSHPLSDVVHPAFRLPTTASLIHQGALKDGFGETVVACQRHTLHFYNNIILCLKIKGQNKVE